MSVIYSPAAAFGFPVERDRLYEASARALKNRGVRKEECLGYDDPLEFLLGEVPFSELLDVLSDLGVEAPFSLVTMGNYYSIESITLYISPRDWKVESMDSETHVLSIPTEAEVADLTAAASFLGLEQLPPINFHIGILIH